MTASVLNTDLLSAIDAVCDCGLVRAGDRLYSVGEPAHSVYIVLSGRVRATRPSRQGAPVVVGELGRGNAIGLLSLVENETYAADVTAIRDSRIARLTRVDYEKLGQEHPQFFLTVTHLILEHMRSLISGAPLANAVGSIAILPAGDDVPGDAIAHGLAHALADHGTAIVARKSTLDEIKQREPEAETIRRRLEELECEHDFVVYLGSPSDDDWNHVCFERADRILLAARSEASPNVQSPAIAALRRFQEQAITKCELLMLRSRSEPVGTRRWLEATVLDCWHHVELDRAADMARLARWMAARTVGYAFSGGGARGFAHLGVVRALREADIPIDVVAGTSMGAIMGAVAACEWDYPTMIEAAARTFVRSKPLRDFTLSPTSFLAGKRISRLLRETLGDRQIEDLPTPFMCVSCNLSKAQAAYHTTGPLWEALRATVAIPGIIAPTVRSGDVHVDGGAIDNMPVEYVRRSGIRTVIAVDVSPLDSFPSGLPDTDSLLRPPPLLGGRKHKQIPSLVSILHRSGSVSTMALQRQAQVEADRTILLQLEGVRMLDFSRLEEIADLGYQAACEQIADWSDLTGGTPPPGP